MAGLSGLGQTEYALIFASGESRRMTGAAKTCCADTWMHTGFPLTREVEPVRGHRIFALSTSFVDNRRQWLPCLMDER